MVEALTADTLVCVMLDYWMGSSLLHILTTRYHIQTMLLSSEHAFSILFFARTH